jgi:hydroxymethylpyrimidine kinase/phosphomethylpyrimidine kinase/thiamine-phosphate diphosphorylase
MLCAHACKPSYIALGAIYPTTTKALPTAPQGIRRLEHYVRLMSRHYPLVAIEELTGPALLACGPAELIAWQCIAPS